MKYLNFAFLFLCISYLFLLGNRSGALPSNTGAPGELTCGRSVCHNISANNGSGMVLIDVEGGLETYTAADTHTISITLEGSPTVRNGFQILALDENDENVGEWLLTEPSIMQIVDGFAPLQERMYITHTTDGTQQSSWSFDWIAPADDQGDITFYVSVLAANNNAQNSGDTLYNLSKTVAFSDAVATSEIFEDDLFHIFPNPAQDWLQFSDREALPISALVYDASGKLIRHFSTLNAGQRLSLTGLKPGVYTIAFEFEEGLLARKFLKI